jgi:hypothetical protein
MGCDTERFHQRKGQEHQNALMRGGILDRFLRYTEDPTSDTETVMDSLQVGVLVSEQEPSAGFFTSLLRRPKERGFTEVSDVS